MDSREHSVGSPTEKPFENAERSARSAGVACISAPMAIRNPPTGRLGIFHVSLHQRADGYPESPNREVGDLSLQP